jgi:hypothetical protein
MFQGKLLYILLSFIALVIILNIIKSIALKQHFRTLDLVEIIASFLTVMMCTDLLYTVIINSNQLPFYLSDKKTQIFIASLVSLFLSIDKLNDSFVKRFGDLYHKLRKK